MRSESRLVRRLRVLRRKIASERASTEYIARGWALGMFVGCFVPFGLQLMVSVPLSFALRCSKIGATVGTLITNPVTIVFIYPAQTWVGCHLLGQNLTWEYLGTICAKLGGVSVFQAEGWRTLSEIGLTVLGGFFLGGLLLAAVMTPLTYAFIRHEVAARRRLLVRIKAKRGTSDANLAN